MLPILMEIAKLVGTVAPTVASAFLSPAAGIALSLVTKAIPGVKEGDADHLLDTLKNVDHDAWADVLKHVEDEYAPILKPLLVGKWPKSIDISVRLTFGDDS